MKSRYAIAYSVAAAMLIVIGFVANANALVINSNETVTLNFDISTTAARPGPYNGIGVGVSFSNPGLIANDTFRVQIFDEPSVGLFDHTFVASGSTGGISSSGALTPAGLSDGIGSIVVSAVNRQLDIRWVVLTLSDASGFLPALFFFTSDPNNDFVVESVSTVPLPAGLPLLAAAIGIFGYFGLRSKRTIEA